MSEVSLSTMWGVGRFADMGQFVLQARELGFDLVELNYQVTPQMLEAILAVEDLRVSSIHIPCPQVDVNGKPGHHLLFNSLDAEERQAALKLAQDTVDLAARVGAPVVVLHLGATGVQADAERNLRRLYRDNHHGDREFIEAWGQMKEQRQKEQERYLQVALENLRALVDYAQARGVRVGLENRVYYIEIPSLEEMQLLLDQFPPEVVGFWYDVGHAEVLHRLGFTPHIHWMQRLAGRIIGVHLHDISVLDDHRTPGKGDMDWSLFAPYLPQNAIRVCELNNANSSEDLQSVIPFLTKWGVLT